MNRNLIIVLAGGFLIAILVAMLVQAGLNSNKETPVTVKEEPRVQIIVASKTLSIGAELSDENMKWQDWPENAVFPGAVVKKDADSKPSDLVQGRVRRNLAEGEPVVEAALVKNNNGSFLAAALAEGKRAVAIKVDAQSTAGGFIGPGDYADIILTYRQNIRYEGDDNPAIDDMIELNIDKLATETILQNVKILAVDQATKRDEEKGPRVGKTVTLEVDMRQAEILALANEVGDLSLSLRRLGDDKFYERSYPVTTDERVTSIRDEIYKEAYQLENTTGQNANIVRIYNGYVMEQVSVGR